MRVGLDIDGVIRPWHLSVYRYFVSFKDFQGDEHEFWNYFRTLPEESQTYYVSIPTLYLDTMPTKDVLEYVPKIGEIAEIFYITACPKSIEWATRKFLRMYDFPFKENLYFAEDKGNIIRRFHIEFFLDDLPKNVDAVMGLTRAYLYKASHNRDARSRYNLINNMREFYELIVENMK